MRKLWAAVLAAEMALSLFGCDKTDDIPESVPENSSPTLNSGSTEQSAPEGTQSVSPESGGLTLLCRGESFMASGCGTEDGYYSLHYDMNGDGFLRVTYIDYASGREVTLCPDSSCKHDTERCTSVLGNDAGYFGEIFYYNGYLYYLDVSFLDESGAWTSGADALSGSERSVSLYRINPDGTGRELVYAFGEDESIEHSAVGDGDCVWFIGGEKFIEYDEERSMARAAVRNRSLVRLDLFERRIVEQIPIYGGDNIDKNFLGVCGDKFVFSGVAYPDGKSAEDFADELGMNADVWSGQSDADGFNKFMSGCEYAYFALDVEDKSMREIYRGGYDGARGGFCCGGSLYIPGEDPAIKLDVTSGARETLSVPEGYTLETFIGGRAGYSDGSRGVFFADEETGALTEMPDFTQLLAVGGGKALVTYDVAGVPDADGGLLNAYDLYALISLDDLYNGRANFEPIEMLERRG
ncbi:MAG: hypothetical protein NC401_15460 [Ruminococcus sp.]|nr:hypothetical protein [Ruminococcus sp.]